MLGLTVKSPIYHSAVSDSNHNHADSQEMIVKLYDRRWELMAFRGS